jgi:hypothetical protein
VCSQTVEAEGPVGGVTGPDAPLLLPANRPDSGGRSVSGAVPWLRLTPVQGSAPPRCPPSAEHQEFLPREKKKDEKEKKKAPTSPPPPPDRGGLLGKGAGDSPDPVTSLSELSVEDISNKFQEGQKGSESAL